MNESSEIPHLNFSEDDISNLHSIWNKCKGRFKILSGVHYIAKFEIIVRNLKQFPLVESIGYSKTFFDKMQGNEAIHFFKLFINDRTFSPIVEESNRYSEQKIIVGITNDSLHKNSIYDGRKRSINPKF